MDMFFTIIGCLFIAISALIFVKYKGTLKNVGKAMNSSTILAAVGFCFILIGTFMHSRKNELPQKSETTIIKMYSCTIPGFWEGKIVQNNDTVSYTLEPKNPNGKRNLIIRSEKSIQDENEKQLQRWKDPE